MNSRALGFNLRACLEPKHGIILLVVVFQGTFLVVKLELRYAAEAAEAAACIETLLNSLDSFILVQLNGFLLG